MMTRISLLMTALLLVLALPARADTLVSGNINTDTHWTTWMGGHGERLANPDRVPP